MSTHFAILLGGGLMVTQRLKEQLAGARVIAADSGILHSEALGLVPELWVGDFDSTPPSDMGRFDHVTRETWPSDKDRTDGEIAAQAALARGATELSFVGGFGGQADHAFAHFMLAIALARRNVNVRITSGDEEAFPVLPGESRFELPGGSRFSLIALTDLVGLSMQGTRWPLAQAHVPLGSSWTLSNIAEGPVSLQLREGAAIAIAYPVL